MSLQNPFHPETRDLFRNAGGCWNCGAVRFDALHHILKRVSSSPFNCAPLHNRDCHLDRGDIHDRIVRKKYLHMTSRFLRRAGYKATGDDIRFITGTAAALMEKSEITYWLEPENRTN